MENISAENVSDAISSPHEDRTAAVGPSVPSIQGGVAVLKPGVFNGDKTCACDCGQPVKKHDYVWGHKSRTRINTIPMGAKDLSVSGVIAIEKTPMHFAIEQMREQISQFEQKIEKLKKAIEMLQNLIDNEE